MFTVTVDFDASGNSSTLQAVGEPVLGDALDGRHARDAGRQTGLRGRGATDENGQRGKNDGKA